MPTQQQDAAQRSSWLVENRIGRFLVRKMGGSGVFIMLPLGAALLLLVLIWMSTFSRIRQEESLALDSAGTNGSNIALIAASSLEMVLRRPQMFAEMVRTQIGNQPAVKAPIDLNPIKLGEDAFLRVAVLDAEGNLLYSSSRRRSEAGFAAMVKAKRQQVSEDDEKKIVIGRPANQAANAWHIPLLQPFRSKTGERLYLGAYLDLGYLLRTFGAINLGHDGRIEVYARDGYRLIQTSSSQIRGGGSIADNPLFAFITRDKLGRGMIAHPDDGRKSIIAYDHLDDYPVIVTTAQSYESATQEQARRRTDYLWWAALLSLALAVIAYVLTLLAVRYRAYHRSIVQSEREKQKLIEALEDEKEHVYHLATHDFLTGLPNRMLFSEMASSHLRQARRSRHLYALLFIDLDRFKLVNDTLGHRVGDLLLQTVARRLREVSRESDIAARLGGDEFVMLLTEVSSVEAVSRVADKIVEEVGQVCRDLEGHDVEVQPSVGIALYPQDGTDVDALIRNADVAMYEAKESGRNTYRYFDPSLHAQSVLQRELLQQFRKAVRGGEFVMHYQPRVSLDGFHMTGLEALVRWQHPRHGLLMPDTFVPLAEEHGLISLLGRWVVNEACRQIALWRRAGLKTVPVAINISAMQLRDTCLVEEFTSALAVHGLPPDALEIELTESSIMSQQEKATALLSEMVEKGIKVAIDDFGTGYSSISYLKHLPVSTVKIDRSLIRDIPEDSSDVAIVTSTITLAHNLKLRVVAEGVEAYEQLFHLKAAGCDEVQGYFFMRPSYAEQIAVLLKSNSPLFLP